MPVREQETTRLVRGQRNLRLPSRKAGARIGTYRRRCRTGPPARQPLAPGSGQAEASACALYSTPQAGGANPSSTRRHGGGACGSRPEKPTQSGQTRGLGNDPCPNGSFFIRLRSKTTSPPPPQAPGGGRRSRIEKRNQAPRLRGPTLTIFRPLGKEGQ